ncbi:CCR4-NOT transcription complex subunit 10 [Olea europaea subsp. europaea]|uniref:CCR4-NOT transcription complex subunit 10 n=1 Tax=Olea europaea subsp. europaea TaxID=158383 RepID=A0A8S0R1D8_OLEEU|nr:CCR4-NOT transcription complex subunit 10 [Olea europaea subsp. europaea]
MALEKGNLNSSVSASDRSDIKVKDFGKGKWRQLAIEDGISTNGQWEYVEKEELFPGDVSYHCIVFIGLIYVKESESRETVSSKSITGSGQVNVNGEGKEQKENQMMKQEVFADLANIELALGNPSEALAAARSLFRLPGCSIIYVFLGNMYAAEALCLLNQPNEAAEHLIIYVWWEQCGASISSSFEESNGGSNESKGFVFLRPEEAVGVICTNAAANYAVLEILRRPTNLL